MDPDPALLNFLLFSSQATELTGQIPVHEIVSQLVFIVIGLTFSSIFSGAEVAFFSIKGAEMDKLKQMSSASSAAASVLRMLETPRRLLATILIGNTFANVVTSIVAAVLTGTIAHLFHFPDWLIYAIEIIVVTFSIVIISEITPKVIAIKQPLTIALNLSLIIRVCHVLFKPLANSIAKSAVFFENILPKTNHGISSDDIRTIAEMGEEQGSLKDNEREIFENVIEFSQKTVKEIMISRVDVVAVSTEDILSEVFDLILTRRLSRMPLYGDDLDDIIGVIYTKDLLPYLGADLSQIVINWKSLARKVLFVPTSKRIDDLLKDFKREKTHLAVVVDEWGGTEGIVTLDDILEELIGDIADETTSQEQLFTQVGDSNFIFDAKMNLSEVEEVMGIEDISSDEDEFETLGGLVYHVMEKIPKAGETFVYKGLEISVSSLENNRIKKILVKRLSTD